MHKLLRLFYRHLWAFGIAHILIVTSLLTLFFSVPPIMERAVLFSQQPADLRVGIYLIVMALLVGTYTTLVLLLSIVQQEQERTDSNECGA